MVGGRRLRWLAGLGLLPLGAASDSRRAQREHLGTAAAATVEERVEAAEQRSRRQQLCRLGAVLRLVLPPLVLVLALLFPKVMIIILGILALAATGVL